MATKYKREYDVTVYGMDGELSLKAKDEKESEAVFNAFTHKQELISFKTEADGGAEFTVCIPYENIKYITVDETNSSEEYTDYNCVAE